MTESEATFDGRIAPNHLVSIGILAWNEEAAIAATLEALFKQSLFACLAARGMVCEIICVANGCTDRTAQVAQGVFEHARQKHPFRETFSCRVEETPQKGKNNAWNWFVHHLSAPQAPLLVLMDADILLQHPDTLWSMARTLEKNSAASISTSQPIKHIALKPAPTWAESISLAASALTRLAEAQVTGQLYCIRSELARRIHLPRDLPACEDGFIKMLACTSMLTQRLMPERVVIAPDASHVYQAYLTLGDLVRNQKRQAIGQTVVHLLIDDFLPSLPEEQKMNLRRTMHSLDIEDPAWLRKLIATHLHRSKYFWGLYPDLLRYRFDRWAGLGLLRKVSHLPAVAAGSLLSVSGAWLAWRFLHRGSTEYWPDTQSPNLHHLSPEPVIEAGNRPLARKPAAG